MPYRADAAFVVRRTPDVEGVHIAAAGAQIVLRHNLQATELDNDLAGQLAAAMTACGVAGNGLFERLFTGIVMSIVDDPARAWSLFYRNTLDRLTGSDPGSGSIGEFAPIYRRARSLVHGGQVLDLASCFGFLPLLLAADGLEVIACDLSAGSMRLLSSMDDGLRCLCCAAEALPFPDGAVDTVLALHLLEHVDAATGSRVLAEAVRVARRRVVIAVPYEYEPTAAYGHVRTFDHDALDALGQQTGLPFEALDSDGGWLILDADGP